MSIPKPITCLGLVGSPRHGGNTERLVDEVLRGATQAGAAIEKVVLSDVSIIPCQGCLACYPEGLSHCAIHDDDMPAIVEKMKDADVWVLGTPFYCYGPTGQFKIFLDRWISLLPEVFEGTRAAVVVPLHDSTAAGAALTLTIFETVLRGLKIPCEGELVCPGLLHTTDLDRHPEYTQQAYELGMDLVKRLDPFSSEGMIE